VRCIETVGCIYIAIFTEAASPTALRGSLLNMSRFYYRTQPKTPQLPHNPPSSLVTVVKPNTDSVKASIQIKRFKKVQHGKVSTGSKLKLKDAQSGEPPFCHVLIH
jgi:hypothetical protein